MIQKFKEPKKGAIIKRHRIPKVGDILEVEFRDGTKSVFTAVGNTQYASCRCCDGNLSSPSMDRCLALIFNFPCPGHILFKSIDKVMEDL